MSLLSKMMRIAGRDPDGNAKAIQVNAKGHVLNEVTGSNVDQRGLLANRPDATTVDAGTTYWAVDRIDETDELTYSDGTTWEAL